VDPENDAAVGIVTWIREYGGIIGVLDWGGRRIGFHAEDSKSPHPAGGGAWITRWKVMRIPVHHPDREIPDRDVPMYRFVSAEERQAATALILEGLRVMSSGLPYSASPVVCVSLSDEDGREVRRLMVKAEDGGPFVVDRATLCVVDRGRGAVVRRVKCLGKEGQVFVLGWGVRRIPFRARWETRTVNPPGEASTIYWRVTRIGFGHHDEASGHPAAPDDVASAEEREAATDLILAGLGAYEIGFPWPFPAEVEVSLAEARPLTL